MIIELTDESFREKVFNYQENHDWVFKGDKPTIIDFWAPWCQPCKMVSPILEELSEEYKDKVDIYKVNTDEQQQLSMAFGIQSIPALLFIPMNEKPQMSVGAAPKEAIKSAIKEILKVE